MSFEKTAVHERFEKMTGAWEGPTSTWFDPTGAPEESRWTARADLLLDGRFLRIEYQGTAMGKPHAGHFIAAYHAKEKQCAASWVDSFHNGATLMSCTGETLPDGAFMVLGSYGWETERWGWRTVLRQPDADTLLIQMFNISPAGEEVHAVEARLKRRPAHV